MSPTRREVLRAGLGVAGLAAGVPPLFRRAAWAETAAALAGRERHPERILVVVELAGGNDGLNTVVPHRQDAYSRARPSLRLTADETLPLEGDFRLHPGLASVAALYARGRTAIVHGCGYARPDRSHFTSMRYWHTAAPHRTEPLGFLGRTADALWPEGGEARVVNLGQQESPAVRSRHQAPIVFADPAEYARHGDPSAQEAYDQLLAQGGSRNDAVDFVRQLARTARDTQRQVQDATARYTSPVSYGVPFPTITRDLKNVAALLAAGFPARVYYLSFSGFDTHADQLGRQNLLLQYFGDAMAGFQNDLERIGLDDRVLTMAFTEFGRRVAENESGGTDHGTATPVWLFGANVVGGLHGRFPDLEDLDDGDLRFTTDFRRVYGAALQWLGADAAAALGPGHPPLGGLVRA